MTIEDVQRVECYTCLNAEPYKFDPDCKECLGTSLTPCPGTELT